MNLLELFNISIVPLFLFNFRAKAAVDYEHLDVEVFKVLLQSSSDLFLKVFPVAF